jgi:hypothetical protein
LAAFVIFQSAVGPRPLQQLAVPGVVPPPDIFGDNPLPPEPAGTPFGTPPKTPVNLLGEVEKWGISAATSVTNVNISVSQMTGAQLTALLQKLPDGVAYSLNLEKKAQ